MATPLSELIRLAAAEQDCCQFFTFAITIDSRGIALEVRAPRDALPVLHSLFAIVGVGAVACAACCVGPILGSLTAIGLGTAAGVALFDSAQLR